MALFVVLGRLDRVEVRFPEAQPGDTWLIVGSDSRQGIDPGVEYLVGPGRPTGARADIVMLVRRSGGHVLALSVPRDLIVKSPTGSPTRLALTLEPDPQNIVDAICGDLGVAVDHLVIVDMAGLMELVDALDGVEVDLRYPIRDDATGIDLRAGPQRIDGDTALSLVRSRKAVEFRDGQWVGQADGADQRMRAAAGLLAAIVDRGRNLWRHPLRLWGATTAATDALTLDQGSGLYGLFALGTPEQVRILPVEGEPDHRGRVATAGAREVLASFTGDGTCRP